MTSEPQHCIHEPVCKHFTGTSKDACPELGDELRCCYGLPEKQRRSRPHTPHQERERVLEYMAQLCAYLHYSHGENERLARETKNKVARDILKGRMFEDCMILDALEELRVKGKIELRSRGGGEG